MIIITPNLFPQALIAPAVNDGCDHLLALSGFAKPLMVDRHFDELNRLNQSGVSIDLIVGMAPSRPIVRAEHLAFQRKAATEYPGRFQCFYKRGKPPCHSKVYVWLKKDRPKIAWLGSANYTQTGFVLARSQLEILASVDPVKAHNYVKSVLDDSTPCTGPGPFGFCIAQHFVAGSFAAQQLIAFELPLTAQTGPHRGEPHPKAGLNWGQRSGRDSDQAYIPIPAGARAANFFPERKQRFTLITDDKKSFVCAVAQDQGKAIHTPDDNTLLGKYFRRRLGVKSGARVTRQHLENYGRNSVTVYKKDDETYLMDFSPPGSVA